MPLNVTHGAFMHHGIQTAKIFILCSILRSLTCHTIFVLWSLSCHIPAVAWSSRSSTTLQVHSPGHLFIKTNNKLMVFDTCIAIPTCTALDCCYTWLCFTTWICVFYVLTSGCVYSIWPVLISPSVYAFKCISPEQLTMGKNSNL